jgi:hypothetical protein
MIKKLSAITLIYFFLSACTGGNSEDIEKLKGELIPREKFIAIKEACLKQGFKEGTEELAECIHVAKTTIDLS